MCRRQKLSLQQVIKKLSETDHGISSEDKDDIESKPELDASSYTKSKTDGTDTEPEDEDVSVSQEVGGKD